MRRPEQYALPLPMAQHKCATCHDTGRYEETWGKTAGRSGRCPHGCPPVPWSDVPEERARVTRHKPIPPLGATNA